ncbi:MAG TPA: hypothetical protein DEA45_02810 [Acholeplasmataceae bacterium]|nr:hypothetical protein [Acholeplasmataceae bacterium]
MLEELLKKPHTLETLQEIEVFLTENHSNDELVQAKIFLSNVLISLKQENAAIEKLDTLYNELRFQNVPVIKDQIRKLKIDALIELGEFQQARIEIESRKNELPILKQYAYYLDLIQLKKKAKESYKDEITLALNEQLPLDMRQALLIEKLYLLIEENDYDMALQTIQLIREMLVLPSTDQVLINIESEIYYKQNNFEKLLAFERLSELDKQDLYVLKALISSDKYRQASIYEVEHEKRIDELDSFTRKEIYQLLIEMYEKTGPIISLETYQKKLKKVIKQINIQKKEQENEIRPIVESVNENKLLTQIVEEQEVVVSTIVEDNLIDSTESLNQLTDSHEKSHQTLSIASELLKIVSEQNEHIPFREKLRLLLIYLSRHVQFSDAIVYINPNVYHYKKERLYDKSIQPTDLLKTVLGVSYDLLEDIVESTDIISYPLDILSGKPLLELGVKQVYSYPIGHIGSVVFYQMTVEDIMKSDDIFKLTSMILNNSYSADKALDKKNRNSKQFERFFESKLGVFRILTDHQIKFNSYGRELFSFKKTDSIDNYISKIHSTDQLNYQNTIRRLKKNEAAQASLVYGYMDKILKENFYVDTSNYPYDIYSYIEDITKDKAYEQALKEKAINHVKYELKNTNALSEDFLEIINEKCSFVLIGLEKLEDLELIYGKSTVDQYYQELIVFINEKIKDVRSIYYLDDYKTLIIVNKNDIRAVEKWVKLFFKTIDGLESRTLKKQRYLLNLGILRYPINTEEKNLDKLMKYLSIALLKSKRLKEGLKYQYFDYNDYVEDQFETNLIKQIDDQITNETLDLCFTQIIDLANNRIYGYDVNVYSHEIDISSQYYYIIASKRNLLEKLEKYLIKQTFKALSEIVKKTQKYVRLSLSISAQTLKLSEFNRFIFGLYEQYQIPYHLIDFVFLMKDGTLSDFQKSKELNEAGITIGVDHLNYTLETYTNFYHITERPRSFSERYISLLSHQKAFFDTNKIGVIFYNVSDKTEQKKLLELGIKYIKNQKTDQVLTLNQIIDIINEST